MSAISNVNYFAILKFVKMNMSKGMSWKIFEITANSDTVNWHWCHCTKNEFFRNFLRIWSYLLKKSLMENFIFRAVCLWFLKFLYSTNNKLNLKTTLWKLDSDSKSNSSCSLSIRCNIYIQYIYSLAI